MFLLVPMNCPKETIVSSQGGAFYQQEFGQIILFLGDKYRPILKNIKK